MTTRWPVLAGFVAAAGADVGAAAAGAAGAVVGAGAAGLVVAAAGAGVGAAPPHAARIAEPGMLANTTAAPRSICRRDRRRVSFVVMCAALPDKASSETVRARSKAVKLADQHVACT